MTDVHESTAQGDSFASIQDEFGLTSNSLIRSRRVVLRVLNSIVTQDVPLTIRFLNARCTITSSLIFIDEASNMLLLACTPEWQMIRKAPADSVMVGFAFDDSKLEFQAGACAEVDLDGTPVVGMPIPEFLWRFQRRREARQNVSGLKITLNLGFLEAEAELVNLSLGGVGLMHCDRALKLAQGEVLRNCAITVPGVGRIPVNLIVHHRRDVLGADGAPLTRVGCQFVDLAESTRKIIAHYLAALTNP